MRTLTMSVFSTVCALSSAVPPVFGQSSKLAGMFPYQSFAFENIASILPFECKELPKVKTHEPRLGRYEFNFENTKSRSGLGSFSEFGDFWDDFNYRFPGDSGRNFYLKKSKIIWYIGNDPNRTITIRASKRMRITYSYEF